MSSVHIACTLCKMYATVHIYNTVFVLKQGLHGRLKEGNLDEKEFVKAKDGQVSTLLQQL